MAMPMMVQIPLGVLAMLAGVLAAATLAGLETGTYVLNRVRLDLRAARGDRQARRLQRLLARPQELLSALLISTNTAHFLTTTTAVAMLTLAGVGAAGAYTTLIVAPVLFVLGDVVPKNVFRRFSETLTYRLSGVAAAATLVCRWTGLSLLVTGFSRALLLLRGRKNVRPVAGGAHRRIDDVLAEGHAHGALTLFQSRMASRVVGIGGTGVTDVMVPLRRVTSLPADCSREAFNTFVAGQNSTRLPMWAGTAEKIVGIVNIYDVLLDVDPSATPAQHMRDPFPLPATMDVAEALITLQRAHRAMGVVTGEGRGVVGIVTIKDLVEEIVGELEAW